MGMAFHGPWAFHFHLAGHFTEPQSPHSAPSLARGTPSSLWLPLRWLPPSWPGGGGTKLTSGGGSDGGNPPPPFRQAASPVPPPPGKVPGMERFCDAEVGGRAHDHLHDKEQRAMLPPRLWRREQLSLLLIWLLGLLPSVWLTHLPLAP